MQNRGFGRLVLGVALVGCQGVIGDASAGPGGPVGEAAGVPVSGARRLTQAELDSTLAELVGEDRPLARRMLPESDSTIEGLFLPWAFDNAYPLQTSNRVYVEAFEAIASDAADRVASDSLALATLLPCAPTGPADAACMRSFITEFGRRVFRRPLTDEEVESFMTLHPLAIEANDFAYGVRCVLTAMFQSPDFVYRVEVGTPDAAIAGVSRLTSYEIATRMAYFLWGTTPGDELLELADEGALDRSERRRAAALDMLRDRRAEVQVDRFHAMWLGYSALPHPPELTAAMREETRALLRRVIFEEERPYLDTFTLTETFIGPLLAEHYGLTPDGTEPAWTPYGETGRAGILSHGSVLSAFPKVGDTSPTRRGIFVRERLLCQQILPPPPDVNADEPPETHCRSEQVAAHQTGGCASCHSLMDPIGWGLERYDRTGRYRVHDEGKPECPIDGSGELVGAGTFDGPGELGEILVEGGELEACVVRQVVRFAFGREERAEDEAFIEQLVAERAGTGWTFLDLLADVVASDEFVRTRPDPIVNGVNVGEEER